ncbi:MAG: hypothetical protein JSS50_01035 [Proteobacteria bacterium]|nr:hypothetical protein [Pseudomonadota bacterium]
MRGIGIDDRDFKSWVAAVDISKEKYVEAGGDGARYLEAYNNLNNFKQWVAAKTFTEEQNEHLCAAVNALKDSKGLNQERDIDAFSVLLAVKNVLASPADILTLTEKPVSAEVFMGGALFGVYSAVLEKQAQSYPQACKDFIQQRQSTFLISWPATVPLAIGGGLIGAVVISSSLDASWILLDIGTGVRLGDVIMCSGAWLMAASSLYLFANVLNGVVPKVIKETIASAETPTRTNAKLKEKAESFKSAQAQFDLIKQAQACRLAVAFCAQQLGVQDIWSDEKIADSLQDLQTKYRQQARQKHSDKSGDDGQFQEMKGYYDVADFYIKNKKQIDLCMRSAELIATGQKIVINAVSFFKSAISVGVYLCIMHYWVGSQWEQTGVEFVQSILGQAFLSMGLCGVLSWYQWEPEPNGIAFDDPNLTKKKALSLFLMTVGAGATTAVGPALSHYFIADVSVQHAFNVAIAITCYAVLESLAMALPHTLWAQKVVIPVTQQQQEPTQPVTQETGQMV